MSERTPRFDRREVIKVTGAGGLGASLLATSTGASDRRGAETDVVETGIRYVNADLDDAVRFRTDVAPKYFRVSEDEVRLTPHATRDDKELIRGRRQVTFDDGFRAFPATVRASTATRTLPTALAGGYRTSELVALARPHRGPEVTLRNSGGSVELHVGGSKATTIRPGGTVERRLPTEVVHVETARRTDTDGVSVEMEQGERSVRVTPTVVVDYRENLRITEQ